MQPEAPIASTQDAGSLGKTTGGRRAGGGVPSYFPVIPAADTGGSMLSPVTKALGKVALKTPLTTLAAQPPVADKTQAMAVAAPQAPAATQVVKTTMKTSAVLRKERSAAILQAAKVREHRCS